MERSLHFDCNSRSIFGKLFDNDYDQKSHIVLIHYQHPAWHSPAIQCQNKNRIYSAYTVWYIYMKAPHLPTEAQKKLIAKVNNRPKRNDSIFDIWSITHFTVGVTFGWLMSPFVALVIMVLWEPLEILVLSPFLAKFGIVFGYETLRNSLSDIFFDTAGIIVGAYVLGRWLEAPFHLF
jgi:hypothetical protein